MDKWICSVYSNCLDQSRENEFNQWYDTVHLPDILETPGIVRASRFEIKRPAEGHGKFLALYEIETEDIRNTMSAMQETTEEKTRQGRMSELVKVVAVVFSRQITEPIESKK